MDINEKDIFPQKKDGDIVLYEDGKHYKYDEENDNWVEIDAPSENA